MKSFVHRFCLCVCCCVLFTLPVTAFADPGDEFFFEDFSATDEGLLPEGWKGGETMAVEKENGKTVLKSFAPGKIDIMTLPIDFPENFSLEMSFTSYTTRGNSIWGVLIGLDDLAVKLGSHFADTILTVSRGKGPQSKKSIDKQTANLGKGTFSYRITIEKRGSVIKILLGNEKIFVGRFTGINPSNVRFQSARNGTGNPFGISKIVGIEL